MRKAMSGHATFPTGCRFRKSKCLIEWVGMAFTAVSQKEKISILRKSQEEKRKWRRKFEQNERRQGPCMSKPEKYYLTIMKRWRQRWWAFHSAWEVRGKLKCVQDLHSLSHSPHTLSGIMPSIHTMSSSQDCPFASLTSSHPGFCWWLELLI